MSDPAGQMDFPISPKMAEPPPIPRRRQMLWRLSLGVLAGGLLLWLLHAVEPRGQFFYPRCHFHQITGLHCPGCGATRALHHLSHARFGDALRSNALLVGLLPGLAWWGWRAGWLTGTKRSSASVRPAWLWAGFGVLVAFFIVRNIPYPPFNLLVPPADRTTAVSAESSKEIP
jgi:hypothetical protein